MKIMISRTILLCVFSALVALSLAQDGNRYHAIVNAQDKYNFRLDYLFEIGCTLDNTTILPALDSLMSSFCSDVSSWVAQTTGFPTITLTSFNAIKNNYYTLATRDFNCGSQHLVTNFHVKLDSTNSSIAAVRAYIHQLGYFAVNVLTALGFNNLGGPAVPQWILDLGWYKNSWHEQADGSWCMKEFFSGNHHIFLLPFYVQTPQTNTKPGTLEQLFP